MQTNQLIHIPELAANVQIHMNSGAVIAAVVIVGFLVLGSVLRRMTR
jgi:hypothetical protein